MDSEVILQPKQMGHSLVVFFFSLVYTSVHKNSEKMWWTDNLRIPKKVPLLTVSLELSWQGKEWFLIIHTTLEGSEEEA